MDELIDDFLLFLKENQGKYTSFLLTQEEYSYFVNNPIELPSVEFKATFTVPVIKESLIEPVVSQPIKNDPIPILNSTPKKQVEITEEIVPSPKQEPTPSKVPSFEWKELVSKATPHLKLNFQIPPDDEAKKIANLWKEHLTQVQVVVFSFISQENGKFNELNSKVKESSLQFLYNFTQAIHTLLLPAKLIEGARFERENKWELFLSSFAPKLIIVPEFNAWKGTKLSSFYRHTPAQDLHFLGNIPLLILDRIENYLEKPLLKRDLWKMVTLRLSS